MKKTRSCGEYTFNGGLVIKDNRDNTWKNIVNNLNDFEIYNIFRNAKEVYQCDNSVKYKVISQNGDIIIASKIIYDFGPREDPRTFIIDNQLYISYSYMTYNEINHVIGCKIKYTKLIDFIPQEEIHLDYGNNSMDKLYDPKFFEKNWLFGKYNDIMFMIYSLCPLIVYDIEKNSLIQNLEWRHPFDTDPLKFNIRAGAPPVLIGDKFYLWAHTNQYIPNTDYFPIVIVLNDDFSLYGYTEPILLIPDVRIIYPVGAIYIIDENKWIVSCGFDDREQIILHIDHAKILSKVIIKLNI